MARIMVDDAIFTDARVRRLSVQARWLWIGLLSLADQTTGVTTLDPALVRASAMPSDDVTLVDVSSWLDELAESRLVLPFEAQEPAGLIPRYHEYQLHRHPRAPKWPTPPEDLVATIDGLADAISQAEWRRSVCRRSRPKTDNGPDNVTTKDGPLVVLGPDNVTTKDGPLVVLGPDNVTTKDGPKSGQCPASDADADADAVEHSPGSPTGSPEAPSASPSLPGKTRREPLSQEEREFLDWMENRVTSSFPGTPFTRPVPAVDVIALHKLAKSGRDWASLREVFDWALEDQFWRGKILRPRDLMAKLARLTAGLQRFQEIHTPWVFDKKRAAGPVEEKRPSDPDRPRGPRIKWDSEEF